MSNLQDDLKDKLIKDGDVLLARCQDVIAQQQAALEAERTAREATERERAEARGRWDLAVDQMLMISSEIHADPKIDHAYSQGDARWTPTLRDAHSLRVRAEAAEARADDLQRQLNEANELLDDINSAQDQHEVDSALERIGDWCENLSKG